MNHFFVNDHHPSILNNLGFSPGPAIEILLSDLVLRFTSLLVGLCLINLLFSSFSAKTNPLADIGVDFDAINRKEKRTQREKSSTNPVTSTITMGKAMGTGSGIGRASASSLVPPPNPMMGMPGGHGIGMGMGGAQGIGMGMNMGMGMSAYGGVNQPFGGLGMNQETQMRPPVPGMPGAYSPMLGTGGGYGAQLPYGGYR